MATRSGPPGLVPDISSSASLAHTARSAWRSAPLDAAESASTFEARRAGQPACVPAWLSAWLPGGAAAGVALPPPRPLARRTALGSVVQQECSRDATPEGREGRHAPPAVLSAAMKV